jgi:toxin CcdB
LAQFDIYDLHDGALVVDCQADALRDLDTRLVVPLLPAGLVVVTSGLNPGFNVDGQPMNFYPQGAAAVPARELRSVRSNLAQERYTILNALDLLLTGI